MLLYSLPSSFENFRCAIESRDELPTPEVLRIKIVEEYDARKNEVRGNIQDALLVKRKTYFGKGRYKKNVENGGKGRDSRNINTKASANTGN